MQTSTRCCFSLSALAALVGIAVIPAAAQTITDGDTIKLNGTTCRLWGIDAAKKHQACADGWPAGVEPLFKLMKRGAKEQYGMRTKEAVDCFNALACRLKHVTLDAPQTAEVSNCDSWSMIIRAVSKIEAINRGSGTPGIAAFVNYSRLHYPDFLAPKIRNAPEDL
jgi:hypothetical protein